WRKSPPGPPHSSSSQAQRKPPEPALRQASRSTIPASRQRAWCGTTSRSRKVRKERRKSSCSSRKDVRGIARSLPGRLDRRPVDDRGGGEALETGKTKRCVVDAREEARDGASPRGRILVVQPLEDEAIEPAQETEVTDAHRLEMRLHPPEVGGLQGSRPLRRIVVEGK